MIPGGKILSIISSLNLVKVLSDLVDTIVTNRKEREDLKLRITETVATHELGMQEELTKRLELDNKAESKLTRNIRPYTLAYLTVLITVIAFSPENFGMQEIFVSKFMDAWWMAMLFYFGSRGVEKVIQTIKQPKK